MNKKIKDIMKNEGFEVIVKDKKTYYKKGEVLIEAENVFDNKDF